MHTICVCLFVTKNEHFLTVRAKVWGQLGPLCQWRKGVCVSPLSVTKNEHQVSGKKWALLKTRCHFWRTDWCSQRPYFKSGGNVSKHPMFHLSITIFYYNVISCKKKSTKTLKKSKSLILLYNLGSRPQKLPKIAQKTDHSIAICSIFQL